MRLKGLRRVGLVGSVVGALMLLAAPAHAVTPAVAIGISSSGPYTVTGQCSAVAGAATNFNDITFVVDGTATGSSTNGSVAVGASVTCRIYNKSTGKTYGSYGGGLPGPTAVAFGTVTVPRTANIGVEWCGAAVFSNGGSVSGCKKS
ncbi:MAG: hypothetical protein ACR2KQ_05790 [Actinomycetota bacterium]